MVKNEKELYEVLAYVVDNFLDVLEYTEKFPIVGDFMNNGVVRRVFVQFSLDDDRNTDLDYAVKNISGLLPIGFCVIPDKTIEDLKYIDEMIKITVLGDHVTFRADSTDTNSSKISEMMGSFLFNKAKIDRTHEKRTP
jgi:hypothetical protein